MLENRISKLVGSWKFILLQTVILAIYISLNVFSLFTPHFDPYPFVFLNLLLSFQAAYTAPVLMISQNKLAENDRLAVEEDRKNAKTMLIAIKNLEKKLLDKIEEYEEEAGEE